MDNNILLNQDDAVYESHFLGQQELPFIFHEDVRHEESRECVPNLHRNVELLYFAEGSGSLVCDGETLAVEQGDLAVINSYAVHKVTTPAAMRYFCLIVGDAFGTAHDIDLVHLQFTPRIRDAQAAQLFRQVAAEYESRDSFRNARIQSAVLQLLVFLCRNYSGPKQDRLPKDSTLEGVWAAVEYMKQNLGKKLTLEEVAAHAGFSKFYFLRLFKRITGCTVNQYSNRLRCEYARELLKTGGYTVRQTAMLCGFDNVSYFTNVFKKHTGCLPGTLLKRSNTEWVRR